MRAADCRGELALLTSSFLQPDGVRDQIDGTIHPEFSRVQHQMIELRIVPLDIVMAFQIAVPLRVDGAQLLDGFRPVEPVPFDGRGDAEFTRSADAYVQGVGSRQHRLPATPDEHGVSLFRHL